MAVTIKIVFLVLAVIFYLASLGANEIKRSYLELTAAAVISVLLLVSMKIL